MPAPGAPPGVAAAGALRQALADAASERYRVGGRQRFGYHFARGKLAGDPMFLELLRLGAFGRADEHGGRFLDLGCGQGVLASWLLAARAHFEAGDWLPGWPPPPRVGTLRGLELMPAEVARAQAAFDREPRVGIEQADIATASFDVADAITILDVLHYLRPSVQEDVLRRARAALAPGGVLVLRVGDAAGGLRYGLSRTVDQFVLLARGHGWAALHGRPLREWTALLRGLDLAVDSAPTPGGLPFANTILVARAATAAERDR